MPPIESIGRAKSRFGLADGAPFAFAGSWERWEREGSVLESCTILVAQANERIASIHDRMSVILDPTEYDDWLDPAVREPAPRLPLLRPFPAERMTLWPVGSAVDLPRNERPGLIAPVESDSSREPASRREPP